jgi:hypothetical protein
VGQDLKGAGATVAGAGFTTALGVSGFTTGDGKNQCRVASSDPAAGTSVAKDTAISVVLYGGKDGNDPGGCS